MILYCKCGMPMRVDWEADGRVAAVYAVCTCPRKTVDEINASIDPSEAAR